MRRSDVRKDISIIGGSAAGLFAAYLLAKHGLDVQVFEATERIDPPPRTLIVTRYMQGLLGPLGESAVINEIRHFELFTDGRVATISLQHPDMVIERSNLIRKLAENAEASGAKVLTGRRFLGLKPNGTSLKFAVSCKGNKEPVEESAEILVGADGAFSKVARSIGWPDTPTLPLIQAVVDLPEDLSPDTTRVWFIPKETPYFFWLIPHSPTQGVLGLIGEDLTKGRRSLERLIEEKGFVANKFQSASIPLYARWIDNHRKIGNSHVYLVGDAAGHVKVSTVGGVVTGFRGALGVVEAILNGGSSRELQALRRELDRHRLIRRVLHGFTQADYCRLLDMMTASTKRCLGLFPRDETSKLFFYILLKQPRLLLLGLRALLIGK